MTARASPPDPYLGVRAHALLSLLFVLSRVALDLGGLPFAFSLDWMWLADPGGSAHRLIETLYFFHAFPPGMNLATGLLLKAGGEQAAVLAHWAFSALGLVLVNALFVVARGVGLSTLGAWVLAVTFSLAPASLYFEHLYLYEWPVATLLCVAAALFGHAVRRQTFGVWLACFSVCALIGATRSTFHLAWYLLVAGLGVWVCDPGARRRVAAAMAIPGVMLAALYAKNALVFGAFAISTFGPASYTLVTVARLPPEVRDAWIAQGALSPFAATSVYAPPREYAALLRYARSCGLAAANHQTRAHRRRRRELQPLVVAGGSPRPDGRREVLPADASRLTTPPPCWRASRTCSGRPPRGIRATGRPGRAHRSREAAEGRSPHEVHRPLLGRYEAWFNRLVHTVPVAPIGLYLFLPVPLVWALRRAWSQVRAPDRDQRARGALLFLLLLQIAFVVLASTMLTALESARYRFQIEWMIWVIVAVFATNLLKRARRWGRPTCWSPDPASACRSAWRDRR